jgi:antitoxin (DNA-binding transcriptional repressor) of toxin-antitoxin stability system
MRAVSISVTEASRNFADCINRARYQGTSFILHKNGVAVARIVPEPKAQKPEELDQGRAEDVLSGAEPTADESPKGRPQEIW